MIPNHEYQQTTNKWLTSDLDSPLSLEWNQRWYGYEIYIALSRDNIYDLAKERWLFSEVASNGGIFRSKATEGFSLFSFGLAELFECRHTSNKVAPRMCIICTGNGNHRWLFLITVDSISNLLHVTEYPSLCVLHWVTAPHQGCVYSTRWKNNTIDRLGSCFWFQAQTPSKLIWYMAGGTTCHMFLFWHCRLWRRRLRHIICEMRSINISLKSFSSVIIWLKCPSGYSTTEDIFWYSFRILSQNPSHLFIKWWTC